MDFCPECGTRLTLTREKSEEHVSTALTCPKCGYSQPLEAEEPPVQKNVGQSAQEIVTVIGEEEAKIRTMPTLKIECPKCGNGDAYWWMVQTRGADESPTQFFRCTRCNYTWRELA